MQQSLERFSEDILEQSLKKFLEELFGLSLEILAKISEGNLVIFLDEFLNECRVKFLKRYLEMPGGISECIPRGIYMLTNGQISGVIFERISRANSKTPGDIYDGTPGKKRKFSF